MQRVGDIRQHGRNIDRRQCIELGNEGLRRAIVTGQGIGSERAHLEQRVTVDAWLGRQQCQLRLFEAKAQHHAQFVFLRKRQQRAYRLAAMAHDDQPLEQREDA